MFSQELTRDFLEMIHAWFPDRINRREIKDCLSAGQKQGWPDILPEDFDQIEKDIWEAINAASYLKKKFPQGRILPKQARSLYPEAPFNPDILGIAAEELNRRRLAKGDKLIALPRLRARRKEVSNAL